jgi:hypothetical protein
MHPKERDNKFKKRRVFFFVRDKSQKLFCFFSNLVEKNTKQKTKQNQYKKKGTKKPQNTAHLLKTALFQF